MSRRVSHRDQPDLLGWVPPQAVRSFAPQQVRGATLATEICKAVSLALKECGMSRDQVADRMSDYLGDTISAHMLNAYASESRTEHNINLVRFVALLHATMDQRLLQMIAEKFGWAVVDRKYLTLIDLAAAKEKLEIMQRETNALHRAAKQAGAL